MNTNGWISTKEQNPKNLQEVLIILEYKNIYLKSNTGDVGRYSWKTMKQNIPIVQIYLSQKTEDLKPKKNYILRKMFYIGCRYRHYRKMF